MPSITDKIKDMVTRRTIKHAALMDKLSEFLAVERGGKLLYRNALQMVRDREVMDKFQEFYEQTVRHEDILSRIIRALGGDPEEMSQSAKMAEKKAEALLRTMQQTDGLSVKQVELNAMENIVLAETKDHADWELLGRIARQTTDPHLSAILKPAVSEVEAQEDEHLNWTKEKLSELVLASMG